MADHQQNVVRHIAPLLTPEQLAALNKLAADDHSRSQEEFVAKGKTYGLMPY